MTGYLIAQKFNVSNRANLWRLREYHGTLEHTYCDPVGPIAIRDSGTCRQTHRRR